MRVSIALGMVLPAAVAAQDVAVTRLGPPNATLDAEFSEITSIRELIDGRVLVLDRKERRLVAADFGTGAITSVGRTGRGPREYLDAAGLFALGRDSTLLADLGNNRWLILNHAEVVATIPSTAPAIMAMFIALPFGADREGRVLTSHYRGRSGGSTDSTDVVLVNRESGARQFIGAALVRRPNAPTAVSVTAGGGLRGYRVPLTGGDQTLLFMDGWVAIARVEPYRVDWRSPNGEWVLGPRLSHETVRLDERERTFYGQTHRSAKGLPVWPETAPPFDLAALVASPDGRLLIARVPSTSHPEVRYDIVERDGRRTTALVLGANQRLAGFGHASAYVVTTDDDGIQRLSRHTWPPTSSGGR